jgi:integrase/recombinase XerD
MIPDPVTENPEFTEIVFTARDMVPGSSESKRQKTAETLLNILHGRIRNKNTRSAYKAAWRSFFIFCSEYKLDLDPSIKPYHIGMWLRRHPGSVATQRLHLAAIRLLFDQLLEKGIVDSNPAARAKPERLQRESAHTPVFEQEEMRAFLGSIQLDSPRGIRDKAMFSVLAYAWPRVSALVALTVEDYYQRKGDYWLRFREKRGKIHEVPVHLAAKEAIDRWLQVSGLSATPAAPLFPAFGKDKRSVELKQDPETLKFKHMDPSGVWKLVQTRARACGIQKRVCCHSFRATGITEFMNAGGTIDFAQRIAGHSHASTTKIYDRSLDRLTVAEINRISFEPKSEPASG